jgi:hypothetical protein
MIGNTEAVAVDREAFSLSAVAGTPALALDLESALLALVVQSRGAQTEASQSEIEHQAELVEEARRELEAALRREAEAEENAGLWGALSNLFGGDFAAFAGLVAAVALTVGTGGAGAPALLAIGAATLTAASKIGGELGLDPTVCKVLGGAGAVLGLASGNFGAGAAATGVATGAQVAQAGATAVGGVAHAVEGQYRGDALDAQADVKTAQNREQDAWFRMELALGILEQCARDLARARTGVAAMQRAEFDGNTALIAQVGAAS